MNFDCASRTHVGLVRKLNEDAYVSRPEVGLWAVADGMGGHQAGDVASGLLAETLGEIVAFGSGYAFLEEVHAGVQRVNRTLIARAAAMAPGTVIGSTIVSLLIYQGHYACLWAGDSRAYLLRGGTLDQLTRDHSMVQDMIDSGALSRQDARTHRRANVITRAVGVSDRLALDLHQGPIEPGDTFILCSDGLTGMLHDHEILSRVDGRPLRQAADDLLAMTLERGAKDNVTFVLIRPEPSDADTLS